MHELLCNKNDMLCYREEKKDFKETTWFMNKTKLRADDLILLLFFLFSECIKKPEAQKFKKLLDECEARVNDGAEEVCTEELLDLLVSFANRCIKTPHPQITF